VTPRLQTALTLAAADIEKVLDQLLPNTDGLEERLLEAMRYAVLGGGKRLRPFLVVESAKLFAVSGTAALRTAAALEMVHCYSLVHDDLPAMDDDDLRRGRATTHKAFDEATAILAGDALLTRAFEVLAHPATHGDAQVRAELVLALAQAAGAEGMCGGQMIDLEAEKQRLDLGAITRLQRMKTGALISFGVEAGAILGKAAAQLRHALAGYAHDLGLAFQIADDLLDVEGTAADVGKATGKDEARGKATFVSLLGIERARAQADLLARQAAAHLEPFGPAAELLRDVARWVVERKS
jgi:farnesyl diphosphate synthase